VHQNVFGGLAPHRPTGEVIYLGRKWKRDLSRSVWRKWSWWNNYWL